MCNFSENKLSGLLSPYVVVTIQKLLLINIVPKAKSANLKMLTTKLPQ